MLYSVFSSSSDTNTGLIRGEYSSRSYTSNGDNNSGIPMAGWQLPGLECLMRMTAMTIAGYIENFSDSSLGGRRMASLSSPANALSFTSPPKKNDFLARPHNTSSGTKMSYGIADNSPKGVTIQSDPFVTCSQPPSPRLTLFPLPLGGTKAKGALRQSNGTGFSPNVSRSASPVSASSSSAGIEGGDGNFSTGILNKMSVVAVRLSRAEDVELFWLDSVKIFADLSSVQPIEVARKSTYCLQACY
jgi:hypothetical protein